MKKSQSHGRKVIQFNENIMSSSKIAAAATAKSRLSEKLHRVHDAQTRLRSHINAIELAMKDLSDYSGPILSKTEITFNKLETAFTQRRVAVLESMRDRLDLVLSVLNARKQQCEALATEAEKVSRVKWLF